MVSKSPEQIADEVLARLDLGEGTEGEPKSDADLTDAFRYGWLDGDTVRRLMVAAIEADRAQREHPMSDPLIELREWASTVSQFMAEDKSNDWREEIAQLEIIEERLDA